MSRINWFEFERQLRALLSRHMPEQPALMVQNPKDPDGPLVMRSLTLSESKIDEAVASALQLAKNIHRKSPIVGLVGSRSIWARSIEELRQQLRDHGFGELYPEEEAVCMSMFSCTKPEGVTSMVSVWVYGRDDIEFQASSDWDYNHFGPGKGAGGGGPSYSTGGSSSQGGWH